MRTPSLLLAIAALVVFVTILMLHNARADEASPKFAITATVTTEDNTVVLRYRAKGQPIMQFDTKEACEAFAETDADFKASMPALAEGVSAILQGKDGSATLACLPIPLPGQAI
jgi:predicted lipid-binding transport protein (Tim44 family)